MPITTTGPLFTLGFWGVVVELLPCDATLSMEVQEAPDTGGDAPDVGNAEIVGTAPPGAIMWVAILSNDDAKRFYRYRHVGPNILDGEWSAWSDGAAPIVFFFEDLSAQNRPSVLARLIPTIQADASVSGTTGTLLLTINDPGDFKTKVEFKKWDGLVWSSYVEDVVAPYTTTITIQEKHNVMIGWKVTYDIGQGPVCLEDVVSYDADTVPEFTSLVIDEDLGVVTIHYSGDDDLEQIRWQEVLSPTAFPTKASVEAEATNIVVGRQNSFTVGTITVGQTRRVTIVAERTTSPANFGGIESHLEITRPPDTDTINKVAPSADAVLSGGPPKDTVTLTVTDPDSVLTGIGFQVLENNAWSAWVDDITPTFLNTKTVAIEEKHNTAINWRLLYDTGGGTQYVYGSVTFDADTIPELTVFNVEVDHSDGDVFLTYAGDDDTQSIEWATSASAWADNNAAKIAALAGTLQDDPNFADLQVVTGIAEGASYWVAAVGWTGAARTGTSSTRAWVAKVTRHIDTDTQPFGLAEISGIDLSVNPTSGDVKLVVVGNENTLSIQWHDQATDYASDAAARTAVEGATTQDPDGQFHRIVVESAIAEGANRFVAVLAYDAVGGEDGTGTQSVEVYRIDLGRPTDTQPADPSDILPAGLPLIPFFAASGTLNFDDVGAANGFVRWDEKVSGAGLLGYNNNSVDFTETNLDHTRTPLASTAGRVWIMYGGKDVTRFTGLTDPEERAFPAVQLLISGQWQYYADAAWTNFTLDDDDGLLAIVAADSTSGLSRIRMYAKDKFTLDDLSDMSEAVVVVEDQSQKFDSSGRIKDDLEMVSASSLYLPSSETVRVGNIATPSFISKKLLISHAVLISEISTQQMTHVSGGSGYGHNVSSTSGGWKHTHNFVVPEGCKIITVQSTLWRRDNVTSRAITTLIEVGTGESVTTKATLTHTGTDPGTYQLKSSTPAYVVPADKTWRITAEIGHNTLNTDARYQYSSIFYQMPEYQFAY